MTELIKVRAVKPLAGHRLQIEFSDGAMKEVDLGEVLAQGGVYEPIYEDRAVFEQVRVNPESQTA